jgi:hypothetical protein
MALLVEPDTNPEASPVAPGRLAIAVVVFRGGSGAVAAGPIAVDIARRLAAPDTGPRPVVVASGSTP